MSNPSTVVDGSVVTIDYTLKNAEGELLDSSDGGDPLVYLHGAGNIVPGLENQLTGKSIGDHVDAVVPPADGYGEPSGVEPQKVPRTAFPDDSGVSAGMQIIAQGPSGDAFPLWVVGVEEDHVLVVQDHPLAGVTLHFAVDVKSIREASAEEMQHGHPHGPGGHHH